MSEPNTLSWNSISTAAIEQRIRSESADAAEQRALLALLTDRLTCELIDELDSSPPGERRGSSTTGREQAPAGWHPDPTGRHRVRWWDGRTWTDYVSDSGPTLLDPI